MANAILNFHFDFPHPSLIYTKLFNFLKEGAKNTDFFLQYIFSTTGTKSLNMKWDGFSLEKEGFTSDTGEPFVVFQFLILKYSFAVLSFADRDVVHFVGKSKKNRAFFDLDLWRSANVFFRIELKKNIIFKMAT